MTYHSFILIAQAKQMTGWHIYHCLAAPFQCAKNVVSDSPWLVDFAIGLMNSVFKLPDGQLMFFEEFELQKNCEINSACQKSFRASSNDVWASKCQFQLT